MECVLLLSAVFFVFFFFKQKTASERRISDWSSDVCSSDLLPISVSVRNEDNEIPARQAGATTVINPVSFAGLLLAGSCHGLHISDYLADLASAHGRVKLHERATIPAECGKPLSAIPTGLGVRIYRNGQPVGFWEAGAHVLQAGDTIRGILE